MTNRTWLITGASSGLGKALTEHVMHEGDFVYAGFRKEAQAEAFSRLNPNRGKGVVLDITNSEHIGSIAGSMNRIDVLVNNAGFGFVGGVEESSEEEVRRVFETNVFGTLMLTRSMLPKLREQGFGRIFQISSHAGIKAFPGFGIYNAAKFALEGFSEALELELNPLGIQLSEPGPFRVLLVRA